MSGRGARLPYPRGVNALLLLAACLLLGVLAQRHGRAPRHLSAALNWWVMNIALPALVLDLVPRIHFEPQLWFLVATPWLTFGGAWLVFAAAGARLGWSRGRIGALILVAGLGNTSFMGYPLVEALRGREGLALAVVADQLGSFIMLSVGAVAAAAIYTGHRLHPAAVGRRVLTFPSFVALIVGVAAGHWGGWPAPVQDVMARLGATLTPLALFSVGLQLRWRVDRSQWRALSLGLGWKLLVAPLLCYGLGLALGVQGLVLVVGVLQAAMGPMISAAIMADQEGLEPPLANAVLGVGIVLSLLTVPLANALL
jgi:predicted permease